MTQFQRLKNFINQVGEGNTFTTKQLQAAVGVHENGTPWKRFNNNPYYTTYLYRSQLRNMGCLSNVKRGLWKVEHNIPVWFGSFHFKGLHGGYDLNNIYAEHSFYWNNLPAEHKVNPFKNKPTQQEPVTNTNHTILDIPVTAEINLHSLSGISSAWCSDVAVKVEAEIATSDILTRWIKSVKYYVGPAQVETDEKSLMTFLNIVAQPGKAESMLQDIRNMVVGISYEVKPLEEVKQPTQLHTTATIVDLLSKIDWKECINEAVEANLTEWDFNNNATFALAGNIEVCIQSMDSSFIAVDIEEYVKQFVIEKIQDMLGA
jgi:hypothetical protein